MNRLSSCLTFHTACHFSLSLFCDKGSGTQRITDRFANECSSVHVRFSEVFSMMPPECGSLAVLSQKRTRSRAMNPCK